MFDASAAVINFIYTFLYLTCKVDFNLGSLRAMVRTFLNPRHVVCTEMINYEVGCTKSLKSGVYML